MTFGQREIRFFDAARNMTKLSQYKRIHIGAVLVYKNRIIATGANTDKGHPIQTKYNKYREFTDGHDCTTFGLHAEMKAMIDICDMDIDFRRVEMYVYRLNSLDQIGNCRPCPSCQAMMKRLGIYKIHCINADGNLCYEEVG